MREKDQDSVCHRMMWLPALLLAAIVMSAPPGMSASEQDTPILWRQTTPSSAETQAMFQYRSPQFIFYRNGLVVYRNDDLTMPYQQVQLSDEEFHLFLSRMEAAYHISAITPERLAREEPYIKSVQKRIITPDPSSLTIWIGVRNPPSLLRHRMDILEARDGNERLGPAWQSLNQLNRYLASFQHPMAKPFIPDRIEIAVQQLPSSLEEEALPSVEWPLTDIALRDVKGTRIRGYRTLLDDRARAAYGLLNEHTVFTEDDATYLVWARPLLLP